jgi:hypothetical protein
MSPRKFPAKRLARAVWLCRHSGGAGSSGYFRPMRLSLNFAGQEMYGI